MLEPVVSPGRLTEGPLLLRGTPGKAKPVRRPCSNFPQLLSFSRHRFTRAKTGIPKCGTASQQRRDISSRHLPAKKMRLAAS
jgi:hypothetical protein